MIYYGLNLVVYTTRRSEMPIYSISRIADKECINFMYHHPQILFDLIHINVIYVNNMAYIQIK